MRQADKSPTCSESTSTPLHFLDWCQWRGGVFLIRRSDRTMRDGGGESRGVAALDGRKI